MTIFILVVILLIVIFFIRDTNKDVNKLDSQGGIQTKYETLIELLIQNNYSLEKVTKSAAYLLWIDVSLKSQITILHAFKNVVITYTLNNKFSNEQLLKKVWEFPNNIDQEQMLFKIFKDLSDIEESL